MIQDTLKKSILPLHKKGTFEEWVKHVWEPVCGDPYVQISVLTALCGLYAGVSFPDNFGMHLSGSSCTGKSTVLKIACSALGNARTDLRGWVATPAGIQADVKNFTHSTMFCDDMSKSNKGGVDGILSIVLDSYKRKIDMRTKSLGEILKVPMCLMGNSEQPLISYLKKLESDFTKGLMNRYIDISIDTDKRTIPINNFKEAEEKSRKLLWNFIKKSYGINIS